MRFGNRVIAAGLVAGLALASVTATSGVAGAAPSIADAKARARTIAAQVATLQIQAESASEDFNAVQEQLNGVVTQYLTASQHLTELGQQGDDLSVAAAARVRALYRAGGPIGLYATVLDGADLGDALSRYSDVSRVLAADQLAITADSQSVAAAGSATAALDALAAKRTQLEASAALAKAKVEGLLSERQAELADANGTVQQLVSAEQARVAAEAAARARATLHTDLVAPEGLPAGTPSTIAVALAYARSKIGSPYLWGAIGPDQFDCSGLTQWAYGMAGLTLPRTSREQWFSGPHPSLGELKPGDLLFWATNASDPASIHHVAVYFGGGYMIEAPHTGSFVQMVPVYLDGYFGATRPVLPSTPGGP